MRFLLFLLMPIALLAQNPTTPNTYNLRLITRYDGQKIILRWVTADYAVFTEGGKTGYKIERVELDTTTSVSKKSVLTPTLIKPQSSAGFEAIYKSGNRYAALAAQAIYGKRFTQALTDFDLKKAYEQHQENQMRFMSLALAADWNAEVAEAIGWRFEDKTVQKDKYYAYIVIKPQSADAKADTAVAFSATFQKEIPPSVPTINFRGIERAVELFWQKPIAPNGFSGYFIERSEDGGKTFKRTTDVPRVFTEQTKSDDLNANPNQTEYFTDSVANNEQIYHYRVIGLDAFGLLSELSNTIIAKGRDLTPPPTATHINLEQLNDHSVRINWKEPDGVPSDFGGYLVSKSNSIEGNYTPITPKVLQRGITAWIDTTVQGNVPTYYRVTVIDTALNAAHAQPAYLFYKDSKPPAAISKLTGEIDTSGHVTIRWQAPSDNDILGYMVQNANDSTHVPTPITPDFLINTVFYDTISLKNLSRKIYYRVIAFDLSHQASPPSAWLELTKPDLNPPMPPVITDFVVSDSSVTFSWTSSPSEDVKKLILMKKQTDGRFEKWQEVPPSVKTTIDKAVTAKTWYEYALIAVDSAGLSSEMSFPLRVRVYPSNRSPEFVTSLQATLSSNKSSIALSWNTNASAEKRFLIYRNTEGVGWEMFQSVDGKTNAFSDKDIQAKRKYQYAIKTILNNGIESGLATSVAVLVE